MQHAAFAGQIRHGRMLLCGFCSLSGLLGRYEGTAKQDMGIDRLLDYSREQ
jgi:hypothetical protein